MRASTLPLVVAMLQQFRCHAVSRQRRLKDMRASTVDHSLWWEANRHRSPEPFLCYRPADETRRSDQKLAAASAAKYSCLRSTHLLSWWYSLAGEWKLNAMAFRSVLLSAKPLAVLLATGKVAIQALIKAVSRRMSRRRATERGGESSLALPEPLPANTTLCLGKSTCQHGIRHSAKRFSQRRGPITVIGIASTGSAATMSSHRFQISSGTWGDGPSSLDISSKTAVNAASRSSGLAAG